MPEEDHYVEVKFTDKALDDFRAAWPDLPPGDEVMMKVKLGPCKHCGEPMDKSMIGGIDPEGITEEGELIGSFVCQSCMEKGL